MSTPLPITLLTGPDAHAVDVVLCMLLGHFPPDRSLLVADPDELGRLVEQPDRFDRIVLRAADPFPALQRAAAWTEQFGLATVDSVITVLDGRCASVRLATGDEVAPGPIGAEQVAIADRIVVTDARQLTERGLDAVGWRLRGVNPRARLFFGGELDLMPSLLEVGAFDPHCVCERTSGLHARPGLGCADTPHGLCVRVDDRVDADLLDGWLAWLSDHHARDLLRCEGSFALAHDGGSCAVVGCGPWLRRHAVPTHVDGGRMVFVGRGLDAEMLTTTLRATVVD